MRQFRRLGGLNIFNRFGLELELKLRLTSDLVFVVFDRMSKSGDLIGWEIEQLAFATS